MISDEKTAIKLLLFISHAGICSRRKALEFIKAGRVKVNGDSEREPSRVIDSEKDIVFYDGKRIQCTQHIYILLHKPQGVTSTKKDRFAQTTVMDLLPPKYKTLWPVGRLDRDTTGLILCTNDGDLSHKLTHPRFCVPKVYNTELDKPLSPAHKEKLEKGIVLEDGLTAPCAIAMQGHKKLAITLREGRKRQVRRMFAAFGYGVLALKRIALGPLSLGQLPEGQWRPLLESEIKSLKRCVQPRK